VISGADHKFSKNYAIVHSHHAVIQCHSGKCKQKTKYIGKPMNSLTDVRDKLPEGARTTVLGPEVPFILQDHIEWSLSHTGYGAIFAPMGSGKTKALEDWIDKQPENFTYLLVVVRKTQASYFSHRYKRLVDYQYQKNSLFGIPRLVCCVNSLERLLAEDGSLPRFDLLILDEIESIISALISKILSAGKTGQLSVWNIFGTLVKSCPRTLIMDGIPTQHVFDYFQRMGIVKDFSYVLHLRRPDFRIYKCYCSETDFCDEIDADLQNGKNVVLVTNTKEIQTLIYSKINEQSKLLINADSEKAIKDTANKPNESWNVRFLAYNTAVGAGASFDLDHFHVMYAVISPNSCIPQDFYQLICRIRKLKESKVALLIMDTGDIPSLVPSKEDLKLAKLRNIKLFHNLQTNYRPSLTILQITPTENVDLEICELDYKMLRILSGHSFLKLKFEDSFFLNTLVDYEHEKLLLRDHMNYCNALFEMIRRNGGIVIEIKESQQEMLKTSTRGIKNNARQLTDELAPTTKTVFWTPTPSFDKTLAKRWNKLVSFNDATTQFRWIALRNKLIASTQEIYEKEFMDINKNNRAISNRMLFSDAIIGGFRSLAEKCPFTICPVTGKLHGRVAIMYFHRDKTAILEAISSIYEQVYNSTQIRYVVMNPAASDSISKVNIVIWKNLKKMFSLFGLNTNYFAGGNKRVNINNVRVTTGEFEFCEETQNIRMALAKIEFDTGERNPDAVNYYINKMNSNR
jgi:hypothetical protein